jgi:hypothetical protein
VESSLLDVIELSATNFLNFQQTSARGEERRTPAATAQIARFSRFSLLFLICRAELKSGSI